MINMLLYQIAAITIHRKKWKSHIKNKKFKLSAPTWNEEFEVPDGLYFLSDIQEYLEYISKTHGEKINDNNNPLIKVYVNERGNRITLKNKTGYYLKSLTLETMKLLRSTKSKITKYENGENVPNLQITEVVLMHCNIVNNDYQQDARVLYTFVRIKLFGKLLYISPKNVILYKNF